MSSLTLVSQPIRASALHPRTDPVDTVQAASKPEHETVPPSPVLGAAALVYMQSLYLESRTVSLETNDTLCGMSDHFFGLGEAAP